MTTEAHILQQMCEILAMITGNWNFEPNYKKLKKKMFMWTVKKIQGTLFSSAMYELQ